METMKESARWVAVTMLAAMAVALAVDLAASPRLALADDATYELTLDANGGTFADSAAGETGEFLDGPLNSILRKAYAALDSIDAPTRPYLRHAGWSTTARPVGATPQILKYEQASAAKDYPAGNYAGLSRYTIRDLNAVSVYLAKLYHDVGEAIGSTDSATIEAADSYANDPVYVEFHSYLIDGAAWEPRGDSGEILTLDKQAGDLAHIEFRIVGINHDERADGDGMAGLTLMMTHKLPTEYAMNNTRTNSGGWPNSAMYGRCGNDNTVDGKGSGDIWDTLPKELRDATVAVTKYSNGSSPSKDRVWLPNAQELYGGTGALSDGGEQYEYFSHMGVTSSQYGEIKKLADRYDRNPNYRYYFSLRTPLSNSSTMFNFVTPDGGFHTYGSIDANQAIGVVLGLCL